MVRETIPGFEEQVDEQLVSLQAISIASSTPSHIADISSLGELTASSEDRRSSYIGNFLEGDVLKMMAKIELSTVLGWVCRHSPVILLILINT